MRKIISFMHVSLDGFVAGLNGEMDWIKINEEIFDYGHQRISKGDTALYGRVTYELMEGYWPTAADQPNASKHDIDHSKWYEKVNKVVLSKTMQEKGLVNTKIISGELTKNINELKHSNPEMHDEILLFGSPGATHSLLKENLIDGFWLNLNPVILGKGIPLFANINDKIKLKLLSNHPFTNGVMSLSYSVEK